MVVRGLQLTIHRFRFHRLQGTVPPRLRLPWLLLRITLAMGKVHCTYSHFTRYNAVLISHFDNSLNNIFQETKPNDTLGPELTMTRRVRRIKSRYAWNKLLMMIQHIIHFKSCYWQVNTDDGRSRCDNEFRSLMLSSCQSYLPCMGAAEAYWLAVRAFGGSSFQKAQAQVVKGIVKCSKLVSRIHLVF